jgi:flagellar biosynthesis/type III secretory pathway protein FliH
MTTITKPTRAKRRTFKDVAATAHAKGLDEGYAKAAQHYEYVQEELLAEIKALQARLGESIWSRLTGLFKGGRHDL